MADGKTKQELAAVDAQLLELIAARARICRQATESHAPLTACDDAACLLQLEEKATSDLPKASIRAIFGQIFAELSALSEPIGVSYLGPEEGFSHRIARLRFGSSAKLTECTTVADALDEVVRGRARFAVFPFESSVDGLVQPAVMALAERDIVLVAEHRAPATYDLVSRKRATIEVGHVVATAAAHAACERAVESMFPGAAKVDVRSPKAVAEMVTEDPCRVGILPGGAARVSGLEVAKSNIGDTPDLSFRFGIASTRPASRTGSDITALLFSVNDEPGSLFEVLKHFAERGINLRRLQSRPVTGQGYDYLFYVEVSGHVTDRPVVTALEAVKPKARTLKVLGSFQASELATSNAKGVIR